MDEFGHLIESSHLDSDDVDDKISNQEPETIPYTDKSNAERSSASDTKEPPVSAQDATEDDASENAGVHKDAQEAVQKAQGGSTSAPWLGSSVTGWLGLTAVEEPGNLAEGEKEDERKETQAEAPLSSSMTEWLWSKGQENPDDSVKSDEEKEPADSFTSTMTGWLGFGGKEKNDGSIEKGQDEDEERDEGIEHEPAEKFRSRRMSLDLEGSQLHEEEREEMGTLEWLGNGLSNKLGFGLTNQESEQPEATTVREAKEANQEQKEPPASWFNQGIGDILGFRTEQRDVEESTECGFKEKEDDKTLEQKTGSEDTNASQSQSTLTEQLSTETSNESELAETPTDRDVPSEMEKELGSTDPITTDSNNGNILEGTSDSSSDSVFTEGAASTDSQESIFPQNELKEKSQAVGGMSSVLNSKEEGDNASDENNKEVNMQDDEGSAELENKDQQQPNSIELEEGEGETNTGGDQGFHINTSEDSAGSNSTPLEESAGEEAKAEVEERAKIQNQTGGTHTSVETVVSSDSHKGTESNLLQTDESAEQSQARNGAEDSRAESHPAVSSGTAEERNDSDDDDDDDDDGALTARSKETNVDHIDSQDMETHQEGEGSSQILGSSHSTNPSNEYISVDASVEDRGTFHTSESTRQTEDSSGQEPLAPQISQNDGDAHTLMDTQKGVEDRHWFDKSASKETGPQATIGTDTEIEKVEEHGEKDEFKGEEEETGGVRQQEGGEEKQEEVMELKGEERLQELEGSGVEGERTDIEVDKEEVKQEVEEGLKGEGRLQELKGSGVEGKQEDIEVERREEKQEVVEEIATLKTQKEEIKGEEMQGEEEEKKDAMTDTKEEEEEQEEVVKLKKEKQEAVKEIKEGGTQEGVEEFEEKQQQADESKGEVKGEVDELKKEEQGESLKEVKETREDEMKESEEKLVRPSDHFKTEMGDIPQSSAQHQRDGDSSETQSERSSEPVPSEAAREDEKRERERENPQVDRDEEREGETRDREDGMSEGQAQENVEAERRTKEEGEEMLKCSNGLCPQVTVDGITLDRGGDYSVDQLDMKGDEEKVTEEQNPVVNKREEDGEQEEEQRPDGAGGAEGKEEHDEKENGDLNLNESGDVADAVDEHDQLDSSEEQNIKPLDDTTLHQGDKNGDAEMSSSGISTDQQTEQIHSDHKGDSEGDTGREEIRMKRDDVRVNEEAIPEIPDPSSDPVVEGQADQDVPNAASLLSDGHSKGLPGTNHGGAFGLFKNAFSYFSQTPAPGSAPDMDSNTGDTSEAQGSLTPEQELHPTTDSPQVDIQGDPPPLASTPSASQSHPSSLSANTGSSVHAKTISKDYKTLLAHMSADETAILMELFGRHKLQFLDYILGSSDSMTDERDHDASILFDIERLLQYHMETLMAPRERLEDAPQEDKEKTRMLIALQKLEILLAKVKETLNTGNLDRSNTNHQGISVYMASKIH